MCVLLQRELPALLPHLQLNNYWGKHFPLYIYVQPQFLSKFRYMETGGQNSIVKPWFWIGLLLLGPLLNSIFQHWDSYLQNVILVRVQAVLTQLVFNHSLRIRLKAEVSSQHSQVNEPTSLAHTIPTASEETTDADSADMISDGGGSGEVMSPAPAPNKPANSSIESNAENLIGKINNLVTSDISNVGQGDDFVSLCELVFSFSLDRKTYISRQFSICLFK